MRRRPLSWLAALASLAGACSVGHPSKPTSSLVDKIAARSATTAECQAADSPAVDRDIRLAVAYCALGDMAGASRHAQLAQQGQEGGPDVDREIR